ncbi:MAG: KPN_02809 family neutral zinc metallopeptidase [Nocardioidaceae bacterium]
MKFNRKAKIDTGQIVDRRGQSRQSGGSPFRMPMGFPRGRGGMFPRGGMYRRRRPMGRRGGMGCGGLALMVVVAVVGFFLLRTVVGGGGSSASPDATSPADLSQCSAGSGEPPLECRIGYDVTSIQDFWAQALPRQAEVAYQKAKIVWFTSSTTSGCGQASSGMGPFYCPADKLVYLDPSFFSDMLQGQLGASGGDLAEAYVVAHEYGHHVQDLLGTMAKAQSSATGPTSASVRLELQADCYAGIWVHFASTVKDDSGQTLISGITQADLADAVNAAQAVGDDRIQQRSQGSVDEEQWTHGSSAERVRWFTRGYRTGQLASCDTFAASAL